MSHASKSIMIGVSIICFSIIVSSVIVLSLKHFDESWERAAVKKGHARWVNGADGKAVWEWLPPCSSSQPTKESGNK